MTPKLYQIIRGGDLTVEQFRLVKETAPNQNSLWIYSHGWMFDLTGERYLQVFTV